MENFEAPQPDEIFCPATRQQCSDALFCAGLEAIQERVAKDPACRVGAHIAKLALPVRAALLSGSCARIQVERLNEIGRSNDFSLTTREQAIHLLKHPGSGRRQFTYHNL